MSRTIGRVAQVLSPSESGVELVYAEEYAALLNRSALIVRVKQPFIDWANAIDDGPKAKLETYEPTLMLIEDMEDAAEWQRIEKRLWKHIFEHQLANWYRAPNDWPHPRTLSMFRKWFDVELHLGVYDTCDDPILET